MSSTFHETLRRERERLSRSVRDAARGVSVPESVYRTWETGEDLPSKAAFGRLCFHFPRLRYAQPDRFSPGVPGPDEAALPTPRSGPPPRPTTFGECLRAARVAQGLSGEELGALLGVSAPAVSQWERNDAAPVRVNYETLLALFTELATAPEPDWRDIDMPNGGRGAPRSEVPVSAPSVYPDDRMSNNRTPDLVCSCPDDAPRGLHHTDEGDAADQPAPAAAPPEERPVEPEQATSAPEPVDVAERLVLAYVEVFGGGWKLSVEREGSSAWCVTVSSVMGAEVKTGEGPGVSACYTKLFAHLDAEIDRRIATLEALRRRTR